jgi:hypothetical protein
MKLKVQLVLILILVSMSMAPATGAAPAVVDFAAIADDTAHATNVSNPFLVQEAQLWVAGSRATAPDACGEQMEAFVKFDLSDVSKLPDNQTITSATLALKSAGYLNGSGGFTMRLYGSSVTNWSEGVGQIASWASRPLPSTDLVATVTGLTAEGTNVVFDSTDKFVDYLNNQRKTDPGKLVTLVIVATTCDVGTSRQYLSSKETTGNNAFTPTLSVSSVPNAVTMSTFRAADPAVNWPLIGGLGALAAVVIGGLAMSRRRAARG